VWTININKDFYDAFEIEKVDPPKDFELEAAQNVKSVALDLFGEKANSVDPWYCTKKTANFQQVYVGTTPQLQAFLSTKGVKEALKIESINGREVETEVWQAGKKVLVCSLPGKKTGVKKFALSDDPEAVQVLYRRKGYTSFMCFKPQTNFEVDCLLMGLCDA